LFKEEEGNAWTTRRLEAADTIRKKSKTNYRKFRPYFVYLDSCLEAVVSATATASSSTNGIGVNIAVLNEH
jgi:hypothetical protein